MTINFVLIIVNKMDTAQKILNVIAKDFFTTHTATSLAEQLNMSRWGVWKILKKLEREELILIKPTGKGKTSTHTVYLILDNLLAEKTVILALAREASAYERWKFTFADLEPEVDFLILHGSILHSPKTAGDIDILSVANEKRLSKISKLVFAIQKTQEKKIHSHNLTPKEFFVELTKQNKVFLDALRRGIVLFGQDNFIQFIKRLQ